MAVAADDRTPACRPLLHSRVTTGIRGPTVARILVVDDLPENITILAGLLRKEHQVQAATSGDHALMLVCGDPPPDLILLDVAMPGMDGFEVCAKLKEDEETRRIPVIFVTAMDDEANEERGLKLGAVDYIGKPFVPSLVVARVRLHLRLALHQRLLELMIERSERDLLLSPTEVTLVRELQALQP